jgi:hypothetical protein
VTEFGSPKNRRIGTVGVAVVTLFVALTFNVEGSGSEFSQKRNLWLVPSTSSRKLTRSVSDVEIEVVATIVGHGVV